MTEKISDYHSTSVVSFDLWLTLIKSNGRTFKTARNKMLGEYLAPTMDVSEFDELVRAADKAADRLAESRGGDVMFNERVSMVAEAVKAPHPSEETLGALYEKQTHLFEQNRPVLLAPNTPQILEGLAENYEVALVSNTGFIHGEEMRSALNDLGIASAFTYMFFSNEVGYAKPDARMYGQLIETAGVQPYEITHIGDNVYADVEGARRMGMNAIHLAAGMTIEDIV